MEPSILCWTTQAQGWELREDEKQLLRIARTYKTKNFVKVHVLLQCGRRHMLCACHPACFAFRMCIRHPQALELCQRFGEVAEQEGHHPDLHLQVGIPTTIRSAP